MRSMKQNANACTFARESQLRKRGYRAVAGLDEAGRGPLAGPVAAAAVILPGQCSLPGLNDSKKLTERQRERLYDQIVEQALAYAVGWADEREIDEQNILNATFLAMRRAVEGLRLRPDYLLIDGNLCRGLEEFEKETIVGGDAVCASIAAASILAKVSRDRRMCQYDAQYPQYGFCRHKGYGTLQHRQAILQYGPCPLHRRSFLGKILGDGA